MGAAHHDSRNHVGDPNGVLGSLRGDGIFPHVPGASAAGPGLRAPWPPRGWVPLGIVGKAGAARDVDARGREEPWHVVPGEGGSVQSEVPQCTRRERELAVCSLASGSCY